MEKATSSVNTLTAAFSKSCLVTVFICLTLFCRGALLSRRSFVVALFCRCAHSAALFCRALICRALKCRRFCWQACFKTGVKQRWPFTRKFSTRLVTSRLLVKWCSVSKPVLVKPALNPIYTSINTRVNNTGLNKTDASGPCKCTA
jgi:hypothetical protein